ncbi:hypothetical protein ACFOW1_00730 [Parasediminibacterium paludis]|jgi:hypothetical protein|uniref:Uncharacterized protein n=1 Tax=Parasediminibacterium paludis TaxID=908966 RepID=A0ABV8PUI3_9BACT
MKLLIITCLKESFNAASNLLKQSHIQAFSATDVTGFKNNQAVDLAAAWFAAGDEKFDSMFIFSFTTQENAAAGLIAIKQYNAENDTDFPIRAFIVPVDAASY